MRIRVDTTHSVAGLLAAPPNPVACLVLAHGAGAGMEHPFMAAVADGLCQRQVACLRFQFPYMEAGTRRPDRPPLAQATVRAAVASARELLPLVPLFAGGKSLAGAWRHRPRQRHHCRVSRVSCSSDFRCIRRESQRRIEPRIWR